MLVQLGLKLVPKEDKTLIILADTVARAEAFAGSVPQRVNKQHFVQLLSFCRENSLQEQMLQMRCIHLHQVPSFTEGS